MGCDFLGCFWGKVRRFVRTFSGRKRYNVLGAMNYVSRKVITVTNDTYITAAQVCELLRKVAEQYAGKDIHFVLDNARYQKCKAVTALAEELGINLEYLPPYSPNLNLIERLWKFVKKKLSNQHFDDFSKFKEVIDSTVASTTRGSRAETKSLMQQLRLFRPFEEIADNVVKEAECLKTA